MIDVSLGVMGATPSLLYVISTYLGELPLLTSAAVYEVWLRYVGMAWLPMSCRVVST